MFDIRKIQEQVIFEAAKAESDAATADHIVGGGDEEDAVWVKNTMKRLETCFDQPTLRKIRKNCQCGYGLEERLALLREIMSQTSNLEEFASHEKARASGMSFRDGELYLEFPFCPCPMVATVDRLETDTWCHCTTGYSKVLFERAFGCEVEVKLLKSIKMGDDRCLQKITPLTPVEF
ncbi:MAG: hypothetical protein GX876_13225 [Bacteroidales bacterium]|nr:hypothetical protein [Bacteroidales bacterium]